MKEEKYLLKEKGFGMLGLAAVLPALILLLGIVGVLFPYMMRMYFNEMSDWVLQEEMNSVMERITDRARVAQRLTIIRGISKDGLKLYWRELTEDGAETENMEYFFANDPDGDGFAKICMNTEYYPLTGNSFWGKTGILSFRCTKKENGILRIEMKGLSSRSRHFYTLCTEVFLSEMMRYEVGT